MKKLTIFFFTFIFFSQLLSAQKIISVDEAIDMALKNNYDIRIARSEAEINKLNNTAGNAGMLPEIGLTGSDKYALNDNYQKFEDGSDAKNHSFSSNAINAGATLSWTLFDGGKMFVTKNKLEEIEAQGEILFRDNVLQTVYDVVASYYEVIRQKQQLVSINEAIRFNEERVNISATSFNAGLIPKTELLQAKIDLNVYHENAILQQIAIGTAKRSLYQLLGLKADANLEVSDSIPLNYQPDVKELNAKIFSANTGVLWYQKQVDISRLSLKEYNRLRLPSLNMDAGYYFSQNDYSAGSVIKNHNLGPQLMGSISFPVFESGNRMRQISVAKTQLQSAQDALENQKLQVNTQLLNALSDFEHQQSMLQIEKDNEKLARENLDICLARLRQGQTTSLEVHQAQEYFVQSQTRRINFEYSLKIAETKLKQLVAELK
ncbi:MAG: TolC family protein [Lentimicrobiaceae bacterium]|nr:TolC family protein [Lentimicrobiaceae bacterium]